MAIDRKLLRWNGWGWAAHKDELASRGDVWTWLAGELGMPSLLATPARTLEEIALPDARLTADERAALVAIVGADNVRDDRFDRAFHALGRSYHDLLRLRAGSLSRAPDAIVYPRGADDVLSILAFANAGGIAVVPFGGGTSVVGGVSPESGPFNSAITLDLSNMDRVMSVDPLSETATAEAGVYGIALEKTLNGRGLTLGHFPQSFEFSTLGGWISHRGAGQQSLRYGKAESWLVSAKLATPRGLWETESFPASAAGPRLTDFLVGSEGTFGVITEATVHIRPLPQKTDYRGYLFHDFASGADAVRRAVQNGVPAAMLRLSDAEETRFYRAFSAVGKNRGLKEQLQDSYLKMRKFGPDACALIAGFEGDEKGIDEGRRQFAAIASRSGALSIGENTGKRWFEGRFHGPYMRDPMMDRGVGVDTLETATSWSKLDGLYRGIRAALEETMRETAPMAGAKGIVMCHISHAYPTGASLYFTHIFPRALDGEVAQWARIKAAASEAIAAHGGTISHHHGVGEDHLPWMVHEKGELGLEALRALKRTFDPKGILNPGKLIPP